jgi:heat shock protein HslJ
MRLSWCVLAVGLLGSTAAMAEGLECQANILYGDNPTVRDVATGTTVTIVPEPYLPRTQVYQDYSFSLGGGTVIGGYTPIPATTTTYEPPIAPEPPVPAATPSTFLEGTMWRLATLDGQPATANATLNFAAGGGYGGRAACNTYGGDVIAFTNFKINFRAPFSTRVACPQLSEEQRYFSILQASTDFRPGREGDTLALLDSTGATLATFLRDGDVPGQVGASIVGIYSVAGVMIDGMFQTDSGFGSPSMEFLDNGRFTASLGCNDAQGSYSQSGSSLTFGTTAVTARQCFVPAPFEGPILGHLPNVTTVQAIGGGISLRDASGTELIRLTR